MAARASFQHEALSSTKAIRVLTVLPSRTLESEIICELCEVQLGNVQDLDKRSNGRPLFSSRSSTSYEALSYVWGSSECDRRIVCNGEYMTITSSCYYALVYLRKTRKRRRLWIDAICINQEWTQERNSQILLMGDIYRHATRVVIWLGVGVNGTRDFLRRLAWNAAYRRFEDESWLGKEVIGPLRNKWMPSTYIQVLINRPNTQIMSCLRFRKRQNQRPLRLYRHRMVRENLDHAGATFRHRCCYHVRKWLSSLEKSHANALE